MSRDLSGRGLGSRNHALDNGDWLELSKTEIFKWKMTRGTEDVG